MPDIWMDVDTALSEVPVNLLPLLDDTDFKTIAAAIAYNASGMALYWHFVTTGGAYSVTAVTPTTGGNYDWTDQGDAGIYTIEIPASGGASINNDTEGFGWFTGFATGVLPWRGPVIGFRAAGLNNLLIDDAYSTTRGLAGTALPAAAADAAGGLPISDAGALDLDAKLANTNEVTAARMGVLTDWIDGGRLDLLLDAIPTNPLTSLGSNAPAGWINAAAVAASALDGKGDWSTHDAAAVVTALGTGSTLTDCLTATGFSTLSIADIRTAVGLAAANLDTQLADIPTVAEFEARTLSTGSYFDPTTDTVANVTTVGTVTNAVTTDAASRTASKADVSALSLEATAQAILADTGTDGVVVAAASKAGYALTSDERNSIAAALLDLASAIDGKTPRETLRYMAAALAGEVSGAGTGTETFVGLDGSTTRMVSTVDDDGNRTAVSYDP